MLPRPHEFPHPLPNTGPQPTPEFLALCVEKMGDYMKLAENAKLGHERIRALQLADGYTKVYRALKS